jgi:hypothetical protein
MLFSSLSWQPHVRPFPSCWSRMRLLRIQISSVSSHFLVLSSKCNIPHYDVPHSPPHKMPSSPEKCPQKAKCVLTTNIQRVPIHKNTFYFNMFHLPCIN